MNKDFLLDSNTKWEEDLSDDSEIKLNATLYRKREQVEVLKIEMVIKIDGDLHRCRITYSTPSDMDAVTLELVCHNLATLYNSLYKQIDTTNKE